MSGTVGEVVGVNGPVVRLSGLESGARYEFVEVGHARLPGEIIAVTRDHVVAQLYEYSGGLTVGEPAWRSGHPLEVELVPGLLGGVYDGLLRSLAGAEEFLGPRRIDTGEAGVHLFVPAIAAGERVGAGATLGRVPDVSGPEHLVLVPPASAGEVDWVAPAGEVGTHDAVAVVGGVEIALASTWPVRRRRPVARRSVERVPFLTGQRVLDLLAPIARGSSATVIGGFGEGKTMLLEQLAKWGDADLVIYVGCGERGNEMTDLIAELADLVDPRSGRPLMDRTIVLANTSNMPVMAREASIYTAVTVAEYYRDMGHHVVIIADSTSRWAEAQRELASRTGSIPAEEGYPADLPAALAAFYQRAGRVTTLGGSDGAVTIVTSVSPPGGDVTEPVAAHTRRFVQAVWALDRDLAAARHYPAVSWTATFSRDGDAVGRWHASGQDPDWSVRRARLDALLVEADRLRGIADLVGVAALPPEERLVLLTAGLIRSAVLQQSALSANDASCSPAKQAALAAGVLAVHDAAADAVRAGAPATAVEGIDFGPLVRAKDTTGPDDAAGVEQIVAAAVRALADLAP